MIEHEHPPPDEERPAKRPRLLSHQPAKAKMEDDNQLQKELKAGITVYVTPNTTGFSGILKQRYTDFLVNEILPDGRVLHLGKDDLSKTHDVQTVKDGTAATKDEVQAQEPGNVTSETQKKGDQKPDASATEIELQSEVQNDEKANIPVTESEKAKDATESEQKDETVAPSQEEEFPAEERPEIDADDISKLESLFGADITLSVSRLYSAVLKNPGRKPRDFKPVISAPIADKEARTDAHKTIRRIFSSKLESITGNDNSIRITAASQGNPYTRAPAPLGKGRAYGKLGWQELGGEYLHFTLYKENKDTMEVIYHLASQLKIPTKNFQFAGTKDRRAATVQRVSVFRTQMERLRGLNRTLRGAKIGAFVYEKNGLRLGELRGNEFVISLRDCHFPGEEAVDMKKKLELARTVVATAVQNLQEKGFINYYGLQRFGSFSTSTDEIGKALLQNNFRHAIRLIMHQSPAVLEAAKGGDDANTTVSSDDRKRALALDKWYDTHDAHAALAIMPKKFSAETSLIRHLGMNKKGNRSNMTDYQGALLMIQRNLRLMYVHAYQSLVWNFVAGKRWELFGDKVVEGDLVIAEAGNNDTADAEEVDADGEVVVRPDAEDRAVVEEDFERARPLSKEEAESGKFTIFDIVLPLPGYDVVYPPNAVGKVYAEFMGSERGGGLDPHQMRRSVRDFSLSGGYRKLLARPGPGASWRVMLYTGETEQLVDTDLRTAEEANTDPKARQEKKNGEKEDAANGEEREVKWEEKHESAANGEEAGMKMENDGNGGEMVVETEEKIAKVANGADPEKDDAEKLQAQKLAVILKMQLGSSTYATMALRELMKDGVKSYKADFGMGRD